MIGNFDEIGDGRQIRTGVGVECPMGAGRNVVYVRPGSIRRAHAFGFGASIEARAIKITLRRVVGRGYEIEPAAFFVGAIDADYVVIAARDEFGAAIGSGNAVGMAPAVAFAEPKEFSAAAKPR